MKTWREIAAVCCYIGEVFIDGLRERERELRWILGFRLAYFSTSCTMLHEGADRRFEASVSLLKRPVLSVQWTGVMHINSLGLPSPMYHR